MTELTDKEIEQENAFLKGLPRINIAALLIPPIWGPVYGFWITILFYPAWIVTDNLIFDAVTEPSILSIIAAISVAIVIAGVSVAFSIVSQPIAAHRAEAKHVSREKYLRQQKYWAIASVIIAIAIVSWATYYNLNIRPFS